MTNIWGRKLSYEFHGFGTLSESFRYEIFRLGHVVCVIHTGKHSTKVFSVKPPVSAQYFFLCVLTIYMLSLLQESLWTSPCVCVYMAHKLIYEFNHQKLIYPHHWLDKSVRSLFLLCFLLVLYNNVLVVRQLLTFPVITTFYSHCVKCVVLVESLPTLKSYIKLRWQWVLGLRHNNYCTSFLYVHVHVGQSPQVQVMSLFVHSYSL